VVLPCIYASELFLFDKSKEQDAGAEKVTEDGNGRINAGINADQSRKSQIEWIKKAQRPTSTE